MTNTKAETLPDTLVEGHAKWRAGGYKDRQSLLDVLARDGQSPPTMVISCADSRVDPAELFARAPGDFFVHRSVANLVPPSDAGDVVIGTAAGLEFAILHLKVSHILILGHSACGGVAGCYDLSCGNAPALEGPQSFIGPWIAALTPAYEAVKASGGDRAQQISAMEKEAVKLSLRNLMTYSFVQEAVDAGRLHLHGAWNDIGAGTVEQYDPAADAFVPL